MQPGSSSGNAISFGGPLLEKGDLVAGKYRVERVIGNGGMGQVVAARHVELGNLFAIKVLRPNDDEQALVRFMREAQAIARIQNEHVVRVHDVGQTDRGFPFIVMEHLDGQDLGALLGARGPLPVDEAVGAILEACDGLADAHAMGIVHRDLKPQNLFLARKTAAGAASVKVVDFGLAKSTSSANGHILSAKATANGEIVGTAGYLAPEQMGGEATPRSDVWSLGVTLYRLLTAKHPFAGKTPVEISVAALTAEFRPLQYFRNDVPPAIEAVIARCLRKIPEERYADAHALHDALLEAFSNAFGDAAPQSHTAATLARQAPTSATAMARNSMPPHHSEPGVRSTHPATFAPPQDSERTLVKSNRANGAWEPSGAPTVFTMSEEGLSLGSLDRRSRLMLLWSGIALLSAILFLLVAIAWRRSAQEARREREMQAAAQPTAVFPPPPPLPPEVVSHVAVSAIAPPTEPVPVAPPVPAPAPTPEPAPEPVQVATAPPEPPPPAPTPVAVAPSPAPAPAPDPVPVARPAAPASPAPAKKPVVKKRALYDTP
jgi:serine/threonine-protein kinase